MGVIHSHPEGYPVRPSRIDDDMDGYFGDLFSNAAEIRPYLSLIAAKTASDEVEVSGRVFWKGAWTPVSAVTVVGKTIRKLPCLGVNQKALPESVKSRVARLAGQFGEAAATELWNSTVAVLGGGGTGSAVIENLARAGVGKIIVIDFDRISPSNLERMRGAYPRHLEMDPPPYKVDVLAEFVREISPETKVLKIVGNGFDAAARRALLEADLVMGCTDTNHGRLLVSDLAYRHLVPALHLNVALEGTRGRATSAVARITRFAPGEACAYCLAQIDSSALARELMTSEEKAARRAAAKAAEMEGRSGVTYWREEPTLLTVGFLTACAAAHASGYAVGMLTGQFAAPHQVVEYDLLGEELAVASLSLDSVPGCACKTVVGHADRAEHRAVISFPANP
jgi:molybdopterin/thiamine biosynthesis adenylyltransferase